MTTSAHKFSLTLTTKLDQTQLTLDLQGTINNTIQVGNFSSDTSHIFYNFVQQWKSNDVMEKLVDFVTKLINLIV